MNQYEVMAKVGNVLTEATPEKTSETANNIIDWFNKPGVKATGYILVATVVIAGVALIAYKLYKKFIKR